MMALRAERGVSGHGRRVRGVAGLVAIALAFAPSLVAQSRLSTSGRVVAAAGLDVPGFSGATFASGAAFDLPVVDDEGTVAFRARLANPSLTPTTDRGIFCGHDGEDLRIVVLSGEFLAALPGVSLNSATGPGPGPSLRMGPSGILLFGSALSGAGVTASNPSALFVAAPSGPLPLVRQGDLAAGTAGASHVSSFAAPLLWSTGITRGGRVVFRGTLGGGDTTAANDAGWFATSASGGPMELLVRRGDPLPGGEVIEGLGMACQVNEGGQTLLDATLAIGSGTVATSAMNDQVLLLHTAGAGPSILLREGDLAGGTAGAHLGESGGAWSPGVPACAFVRDGSVLVVTDLFGGDVVPGVNDRGLFIASVAGNALVARKGDAAPGTSALFGTMGATNLAFAEGSLAFQSTLSGPSVTAADDTGIWTRSQGVLALAAREGDPAPGTLGARFGSFSGTQLLVNDRGQLVFSATLTGGDVVGAANGTALYLFDRVTGIDLVLRGGETMAIAPGVVRTVSTFAMVPWNGGDGRASAFTHDGDLALRVTMTDGTAAIVTGRLGALDADLLRVSALDGGTQTLTIRAGAANAGQPYLVLGTASGISPGFAFGAFRVPLNPDAYTMLTVDFAGVGPFANTLGLLGPAGTAVASITLPPALGGLAGTVLHHAVGVADFQATPRLVSAPVRLEIGP